MILVVDIGSNSIRTMTAERAESGFGFSCKAVYTTRLAEGLDKTGLLSQAAMRATLAVLADAAALGRANGAALFAYATSAVRDAANRADFLLRAESALGVPVRVLSGREEARYAYLGATAGTGALIDIGGGSAQIVTETNAESFPIGCVRARDFGLSCAQDVLSPAACLEVSRWVDARTDALRVRAARWTGVGGTITTLGALSLDLPAYDPALVSGAALTPEALAALIAKLNKLGDARRAHPLLTQRHDVIVWGALVLARLMERLSVDALFVSDADGMEGYAMEVLGGRP